MSRNQPEEPSQDEIIKGCEKIREAWNAEQYLIRSTHLDNGRSGPNGRRAKGKPEELKWHVPEIAIAEMGLTITEAVE